MAYARLGPGSDVYVYLSVSGHLECCACSMDPPEGQPWTMRKFRTTEGMLRHLREHRARGHMVPDRTFTRLKAERAENDLWMGDPNDDDQGGLG